MAKEKLQMDHYADNWKAGVEACEHEHVYVCAIE
jgi:hypothetical protein